MNTIFKILLALVLLCGIIFSAYAAPAQTAALSTEKKIERVELLLERLKNIPGIYEQLNMPPVAVVARNAVNTHYFYINVIESGAGAQVKKKFLQQDPLYTLLSHSGASAENLVRLEEAAFPELYVFLERFVTAEEQKAEEKALFDKSIETAAQDFELMFIEEEGKDIKAYKNTDYSKSSKDIESRLNNKMNAGGFGKQGN